MPSTAKPVRFALVFKPKNKKMQVNYTQLQIVVKCVTDGNNVPGRHDT